MPISLQPGEYRLYSDTQLPTFQELATDVEDPVQSSARIRIYPNPACEQINIESPEDIFSLKLYNLDGQLVKQQNVYERNVAFPLNQLPQGMYILQINTRQNSHSEKILKSE